MMKPTRMNGWQEDRIEEGRRRPKGDERILRQAEHTFTVGSGRR